MENPTVNNTVELINFLLGINIKLKEIHWKTENNAIDEPLNDLHYYMKHFLDSCVEIVLSLNSRDDLNTGSLQAEPIPVNEPHELINLMNNRILNFKNYIKSLNDINYSGLIAKINEFIADVNIIKYKSELK